MKPVFDRFGKALGALQNHEQLSVKGLANVRSFLRLGVLAVLIALGCQQLMEQTVKTDFSFFLIIFL